MTSPTQPAATVGPGVTSAPEAEFTSRPIPFAKRALDVVGAALGLVLLSPLILVAAVLIRLDSPGPALFKQARIGRGGRPFRILKLRSMSADADQSIHREHVSRLMSGSAAENIWAKLEPDPRLTTVGRWLRATAVDELPQLVNVFRGEMSLVGPRPALPYELEHYEHWHFERLGVAPGITGLWQVEARGESDFDEMVQLDIDYIHRSSVGLDIALLSRTPMALWRGSRHS